MLYVTHDESEAQLIADHVVMIDGGRIVAAGTPGVMLSSRSDGAVVTGHIAEQMESSARTRVVAEGRDYVVPGIGGNIGDRVTLRISVEAQAIPPYMARGVPDPA